MAATGKNETAVRSDRELSITRTFDAPIDLVWSVWTDPNHLTNWWGPDGFTTSTYKMDVRPGGVWRFTMHGPDGRDYENKITYLEVEKHKRLVYTHGDDQEHDKTEDSGLVGHHTTVDFEEVAAGKTRVSMRAVFASPEALKYVVDNYHADTGMVEHMGNLGRFLAAEAAGEKVFVIARTFDAPRELVWKAWTEKDRLMQWFGPKGFERTASTLDFRPGGTFHYGLRSPDGKEMWGKFLYREIVPPQRIVLVNMFSDKDGGITRHPFAPDWPLQMLTTTTFGEHRGKTTLTLRWQPLNPTPAERKAFNDGLPGMNQGWGGTFELLTEYLAKNRA